VLERQLDAQVAAGDHDAVEGEHDGLEVVDRLGLLQLGDHRQPGALRVHDLVDEVDVGGAAHERERDHVDPQVEGELEVGHVLVRQRGHRHVHARQRDALVVADRPALGDAADHVHALDGGDAQPDLAVVDEQPVFGAGVVGEALVGGGDAVVRARHVVDGDPHLLAGAPLDRARREPPEADLGALQVGEDADRAPLGVGRVPDHVVDLLVVLARAVAEVQPRDVHACLHELPDAVRGRGGRTDGADDLCASAHTAEHSARS
jgi:hypothetical protein